MFYSQLRLFIDMAIQDGAISQIEMDVSIWSIMCHISKRMTGIDVWALSGRGLIQCTLLAQ